jgi:hypothetical protein
MQLPGQKNAGAVQTVAVPVQVSVQSVDSRGMCMVIDAKGHIYPLISQTKMWGSGASPQPGEDWMIQRWNGDWTFTSRVISNLPVVNSYGDLISSMVQLGLVDPSSSSFLPGSYPGVVIANGFPPGAVISRGTTYRWDGTAFPGDTEATQAALLGNAIEDYPDAEPSPDWSTTFLLTVTVVARATSSPHLSAAWRVEGLIEGDGVSAYTIIGQATTALYADTGTSAWLPGPLDVSFAGSFGYQVQISINNIGSVVDWMFASDITIVRTGYGPLPFTHPRI